MTPDSAPFSAAVNRLWLPRPSLAACVRGVMSRSTVGVPLVPAQRFNHAPVTPLCSLSWWFAGCAELLPDGAPMDQAVPRQPMPGRIVLAGPRTQPTVSWNPGEAHAMLLMLMPDALHRLTGLAPADFVDRFVAAEAVLPPDWMAMCEAVLHAADDDARVAVVEDFLDPRWQAARPHRMAGMNRYHDWAQSLALSAVTSGPGRSLRQVERRIKRWAGLPLRELQGMGRGERAFFAARDAELAGQRPNWAEVADDNGYADQSHLCRETRRMTGFSPAELHRRVVTEEAFWAYRLWQ